MASGYMPGTWASLAEMAPGCAPAATMSSSSTQFVLEMQAGGPDIIILGAVSGRDGVGLHAGGHVVVVLNAS
jgi:hypothetical protein